ncbi:MAG: hypothetical protein AAGF47_09400 [Planctomycetota bacterium]
MPEATHPVPVPVPLDRIFGHDAAIGQLTRALAADRLHHAWVFHGPAGVGKMTTALAFAALALDPTTVPGLDGRLAPEPQSRCQQLLAAGSHPDLHVVTKELARFSEDAKVRAAKLATIPKDVVETHLLRPAALMPKLDLGGAVSKVFIVDEAELLDRSPTNAPVQNAVLKTLEEPPPGTLIVLVTSAEERLLPTIRSRCQRARFARLDERAMAAWLETADLTSQQRAWALAHGRGAPGAVLQAVATGLDRWREALEPMILSALGGRLPVQLGASMAELVGAWSSAVVEGDKTASKDAANRAGASHMLAMVADVITGAMRQSPPQDAARLAERLEAIAATQARLGANVNQQMAFAALASELAYPRRTVSSV